MTTTLTVNGDGITVEREVPDRTAPQLIETTMDGESEVPETVTMALAGEGMEYEREVSIAKTPKILEVVLQGGEVQEVENKGLNGESLPDDFFRRLTDKQEALIRVLLDEDGWTLTEDVIRKMEEQYDYSIDGGRGIAGILSGISRKHTKEFRNNLIQGNWTGDQAEFKMNKDFEKELRAGLDS